MPTSEDVTVGASDYEMALEAFLATHVPARGRAGVLQAWAAVRDMPYFSGPDRTPLAALRSGRGACTAKHLVLRDLLRRIGQRAVVEIVEGDFSTAVPAHPSMPEALRALIAEGGVTDFHCRVRLDRPEGAQRIDATWPAGLEGKGFAVDRIWSGRGDTKQAMAEVILRAEDDDVLTAKATLLAGLEEQTASRRQDFLRLLSAWLDASQA